LFFEAPTNSLGNSRTVTIKPMKTALELSVSGYLDAIEQCGRIEDAVALQDFEEYLSGLLALVVGKKNTVLEEFRSLLRRKKSFHDPPYQPCG